MIVYYYYCYCILYLEHTQRENTEIEACVKKWIFKFQGEHHHGDIRFCITWLSRLAY